MRWATPERRAAKVEKLAEEVCGLPAAEYEGLRELLEEKRCPS